jgi:biopolymer transport protein ExbD
MSITFQCSACGKKLAASDRSAGKQKTCPQCGSTVTVPGVAATGGGRETKNRGEASAPPSGDPSVEGEEAPLIMPMRSTHHGDLIDMTAMVDIVFFLLIFFLVTSLQSLEAVIGLPAPEASESAADGIQVVPDFANDPNFIVVTIDADDTVWVEDEEAPSEQDLRAKLRAARREDEERDGLLINGSSDATHGTFVMVLDAGADVGLKELLFSVQQSEEEAGGG